MNSKKCDVNAVSVFEGPTTATPLFAACQLGYSDIVTILMGRKNIDVNAGWFEKSRADTVTPIYIAAQNGYHEIVAMLLRHAKIKPDKGRTDSGASPLHIGIVN